MRAKTILTVLFALSLVVGGYAAIQVMSQKGAATAPKEYVLATTMPLPVGTLLRAQDVSWQPVAETEPDEISKPNATAVAEKPDIVEETQASVFGAVLRHPLAANAPIRRSDFVKPGDRDFLQVVLTPGSRAIAIPVATGGASTGLLTPGDRVDVVLTQNFKGDSLANAPLTRRSVSETVVQNLRVLAIDAIDPTKVNNANPASGNFGRTVTLEVTAEQAEQINVAAELGKLSLTLLSASATDYASATPAPSFVKTAAFQPVDGHSRVPATWAGDVSPALTGAAQERPTAVTPPTITILRGFKSQSGGKEPADPVIIKPES